MEERESVFLRDVVPATDVVGAPVDGLTPPNILETLIKHSGLKRT